MNNLVILPLLVPLCTAIALLFMHKRVRLQRLVSLLGALVNLAGTIILVYQVRTAGIQTLYMGGWVPPYGIVFVADMLAALLVLTTAIVSVACLIFAFGTIGESKEQHYFYPFFQFLITGVSGSFLTGDLFNLFVCFEVMLISSYALLGLGGSKRQLREGLKYILINILSSTLFVAAVAYLYGITGTLNMAHLSQRVAEVGQGGMLSVVAMLLLIVFALKAGLFLFYWLPGSYSAPPTVVRALFGALLTKVGLYAIIRTFTLIFYHDAFIVQGWIGWMAALTMILGAIGAVAYSDIHRIFNYNIIISVGFIAAGIAMSSPDALDGSVFYLIHDMLAKTLLFLLGGMMISAAGSERLQDMGGLIQKWPIIGWIYLTTALALVGIPPLSGFVGKVLIVRGGLDAGSDHAQFYILTGIAVASSFVVLYSLVRVFIRAFWGEKASYEESSVERSSAQVLLRPSSMIPVVGLLVLILLVGFGSEGVYTWVSQAGEVLTHPELYIEAVLKE